MVKLYDFLNILLPVWLHYFSALSLVMIEFKLQCHAACILVTTTGTCKSIAQNLGQLRQKIMALSAFQDILVCWYNSPAISVLRANNSLLLWMYVSTNLLTFCILRYIFSFYPISFTHLHQIGGIFFVVLDQIKFQLYNNVVTETGISLSMVCCFNFFN